MLLITVKSNDLTGLSIGNLKQENTTVKNNNNNVDRASEEK